MKKSIAQETKFPPPGRTPREDTAAVMKFYRLRDAFPREVIEEAKQVSKRLKTKEKRLDLRRKFIFTCDPETARDYDDAISLEKDRKGNRVLGVHIADVSHFVKLGSALDREAQVRSTSVYFPDRVLPMLPEELSNGVCSLVPNEDRLTFSVFMTFDAAGRMIARSFAKSIIRSKARYTYEQVMDVIAGRTSPIGKRESRVILALHALAQQLRQTRFGNGALDLEIPEIEVRLDDQGEMLGIESRPYDESHQLIEECMIAANEAVAQELWGKGIKILARFHDKPDPEKLLILREEMRGLGVKMGAIENPKVFARFLQAIKKDPLYPTLAVMVLRSMKRAVYEPTVMGHFGLSKRFYAHFTSPIRRYPDLTLHRQLADYLEKPTKARRPEQVLARWAEHANEMEEKATEAERAVLEIKKYRFFEEQLASRQVVTYEGVISQCFPFGCFVEIPELAASGLVHISQLSRRYVRYNAGDHSLSAPGGGSWKIGDKIKVRVTRVDFKERKLDFVPVNKR